jgi:hypothetical protein
VYFSPEPCTVPSCLARPSFRVKSFVQKLQGNLSADFLETAVGRTDGRGPVICSFGVVAKDAARWRGFSDEPMDSFLTGEGSASMLEAPRTEKDD